MTSKFPPLLETQLQRARREYLEMMAKLYGWSWTPQQQALYDALKKQAVERFRKIMQEDASKEPSDFETTVQQLSPQQNQSAASSLFVSGSKRFGKTHRQRMIVDDLRDAGIDVIIHKPKDEPKGPCTFVRLKERPPFPLKEGSSPVERLFLDAANPSPWTFIWSNPPSPENRQ